ncbi:MAG: Rpn family recombination-promoting nuclease/putative transposase [Atopobiaceae bacterium]|nr:Rpn family recombination-promoting nuclease/putative transposase [Atopobiaceae bacterium]
MPVGNGEYKDRLFNFLFGSEENRGWTLSLYNAVNGSAYDDPSQIRFTTIREVMYLGMRNDVSFLVAGEMSLYEQQSSFNPNMPLRMLQYLGNLYQRHLDERKLNKYGPALVPLPAPRLVVFYNGERQRPDEEVMRLSDAFPEGAEADVEVRVRAVNVNRGRSPALLAACAPLREYSWLVAEVREGVARDPGAELGTIIDRAIEAMPNDFEIKPFLTAHKAEVRGMLLTEYDEAKAMELFREDGRREGMREGMRMGRLEGMREGMREGAIATLRALVEGGLIAVSDAAAQAGMTVDEFERAASELTTS